MKHTDWNEGIREMLRYSVLEVCLEDNPDFENKARMTQKILEGAVYAAAEIESFLKTANH